MPALLLALFLALAGSDWPQFLGPSRDGSTSDGTLARGWLENGKLRERFRVPVGEGFAGIAVGEGRAYTMDTDGRSEFVFALDSGDGRHLWKLRTGSSPRDNYGGHGPRTTPTFEGDRLFVLTAEGKLLSLLPASGELDWERDLKEDFGFRPPAEGAAASPLVWRGRLLVVVGGAAGASVGAFDRRTGKTLWTRLDDRASYSSPVVMELQGAPQALFFLARRLVALSPGDGALLWSYPWETYDGVNVATPIAAGPNRIFISSGYDQGAALLDLGRGDEPQVLWRNREMKNHFNNSVFRDGVLYGFDMAILKAIDAESGRTLWRERGFGTGSVVVVGDHLVVLSDEGEVALVEPDRAGLRVLKRQSVLDSQSWTPPSIASGRLYLRNHRELVALEP
jgi:outer membrane protein assembly factor BamB